MKNKFEFIAELLDSQSFNSQQKERLLNLVVKEFGEEAITTLGKQLVKSMHPAEMVKSERRNRVKPAISIMPYFFTKMALPGSVMQAVWPEDGAIVSPIFMLTKKSYLSIPGFS